MSEPAVWVGGPYLSGFKSSHFENSITNVTLVCIARAYVARNGRPNTHGTSCEFLVGIRNGNIDPDPQKVSRAAL